MLTEHNDTQQIVTASTLSLLVSCIPCNDHLEEHKVYKRVLMVMKRFGLYSELAVLHLHKKSLMRILTRTVECRHYKLQLEQLLLNSQPLIKN